MSISEYEIFGVDSNGSEDRTSEADGDWSLWVDIGGEG